MKVNIAGKHMELGDSFQKHVEGRVDNGFSKYLDKVNKVEVVVTKEGKRHRVDIHGNLGTHAGVTVKSQGESEDVYAAFDDAAAKIEKQLRRYKRRITNHHQDNSAGNLKLVRATKYVLAPEKEEELDEKGAPVVVAEKATDVETLTVSQAVMKMDLANLPALVFINSGNGRLNVVYHREDGNISWVDPQVQ